MNLSLVLNATDGPLRMRPEGIARAGERPRRSEFGGKRGEDVQTFSTIREKKRGW
jgi:hypothetical protein